MINVAETTTETEPAVSVTHAPPVILATTLPLDDPKAWLAYPAYEAPLSPEEIEAVQKDIDSIIGTTRENKSIAKLVWNGDVRYWKQFHTHWDRTGQAIGDPYKRPQVLYKSVHDSNGVFVRDAFVPRFLIMTRIEPEQYAATWATHSTFYHPDLGVNVQILPSEVPKERHVWFMTIAQHIAGCCQRAAQDDRECYGRYAHPRFALEELRQIRKGMEASNLGTSHPFDSPDRMAERVRDRGCNDYIAQAMKKFAADRKRAIDLTPMAMATPIEYEKTPNLVELRRTLHERSKRDLDDFEKELNRRKIQ